MVGACEMGVIGGDEVQVAPISEQKVGDMAAFAAIGADGAGVVVDLHRVGRFYAARIRQCHARPVRMGDGHEGPGLAGAPGDLRPGFLAFDGVKVRRVGRQKIRRQADGKDVPQLTVFHGAGMQLGTGQGGEDRVPEVARVGDRIVKPPDEMIGQRNEIIAFRLVAAADLRRVKNPVRPVGMAMQVAAEKLSGGGKSGVQHGVSPVRVPRLVAVFGNGFVTGESRDGDTRRRRNARGNPLPKNRQRRGRSGSRETGCRAQGGM